MKLAVVDVLVVLEVVLVVDNGALVLAIVVPTDEAVVELITELVVVVIGVVDDVDDEDTMVVEVFTEIVEVVEVVLRVVETELFLV